MASRVLVHVEEEKQKQHVEVKEELLDHEEAVAAAVEIHLSSTKEGEPDVA